LTNLRDQAIAKWSIEEPKGQKLLAGASRKPPASLFSFISFLLHNKA
jgi:hypothetical protein